MLLLSQWFRSGYASDRNGPEMNMYFHEILVCGRTEVSWCDHIKGVVDHEFVIFGGAWTDKFSLIYCNCSPRKTDRSTLIGF